MGRTPGEASLGGEPKHQEIVAEVVQVDQVTQVRSGVPHQLASHVGHRVTWDPPPVQTVVEANQEARVDHQEDRQEAPEGHPEVEVGEPRLGFRQGNSHPGNHSRDFLLELNKS